APAAILAVLTIHCSTPPRICATHRTTLRCWVVLIFKAVKISSPKAYLLLISTPAAVLFILTPIPSPFQGEGCLVR
ncbi:MAG: hypothetical protein WHT29_11430, partial [Bacteroidales bacterium]